MPAPPQSPENAERHGQSGIRRVFVNDFEIVASVGVFEHEKRYEQRILL